MQYSVFLNKNNPLLWATVAAVLMGGATSSQVNAESTPEYMQEKESSLWHTANDAVENFQNDTLQSLLDESKELANSTRSDGYTLLESAAYDGNIAAVKILLDHGADPNTGSRPPLSSALPTGIVRSNDVESRKKHYEIIMLLHEHGADYNFQYIDDASFIEGLIMEVCDSRRYDEDLLTPFKQLDFKAEIKPEYLRNIHFIEMLSEAPDGLNSECVDLLTRRISKAS